MKWQRVPKSPVFPPGHRWEIHKRREGYESELTALVRSMLQDDAVREDQARAWERWRNDEAPLRNKVS
jgi:hypothetical protein